MSQGVHSLMGLAGVLKISLPAVKAWGGAIQRSHQADFGGFLRQASGKGHHTRQQNQEPEGLNIGQGATGCMEVRGFHR
jgi:hypothetical protein